MSKRVTSITFDDRMISREAFARLADDIMRQQMQRAKPMASAKTKKQRLAANKCKQKQ